MTRVEFLVEAARGSGRAIIALQNGEFQPSVHDMRRLILRWAGFDSQLETTRGWYCAELISGSGFVTELEAIVIQYLARTKGPKRNRRQREAIVSELAKRGLSEARVALYAHYDPNAEFRLAEEIIEVDGLDGLQWLISNSSEFLIEANAWTFKWWVDDLGELVGEKTVSEWLVRNSIVSPDVAEFARLAKVEPEPDSGLEAPERPTLDDLRENWGQGDSNGSSVEKWLRTATENELDKAWRSFELDNDFEWLRRLACCLRRKPENCDIDKIIKRAISWDHAPNPFVLVLEEIEDPKVRQLGFDLIASDRIVDGVALFQKNCRPEDVNAVLAAFMAVNDDWSIHRAGMDLLQLNAELDTREILIQISERTPCSFCRETAVNKLIERNEAPESLLRVWLFDCSSDTREMAMKELNSKFF